jgi:hypothetical protein
MFNYHINIPTLSDYLHRLKELEVAYPKAKPSNSTANARNSVTDSVGNKDRGVIEDRGGLEKVTRNDATKKSAGHGHRRYVPVKYSHHINNN